MYNSSAESRANVELVLGEFIMASKKRGTATASNRNKLRISRRVVNTKRHTVGYIAKKKFYSTPQITRMAKRGEVSGVRVVGNHIQAPPGRRRLVDLPTEVRTINKRKRNR